MSKLDSYKPIQHFLLLPVLSTIACNHDLDLELGLVREKFRGRVPILPSSLMLIVRN